VKKLHRFLISLNGLCFLSACGGSGLSAPPPPPSATHLSVTAPATATVGTAVSVTVTALDASNNTVTTYSGTVHFTSTDGQAALPANSPLTNGTGIFQVTLNTPVNQTITATDTVTASISGTANSIQVSAPASGFTATGSMLTPRESHTATLLIDARVLVAGGMHWAEAAQPCRPCGQVLSALASAELFDPATGTFTSAGNMSAPRVFHTATLLGNGKVLIAGGDDRQTTIYATAQLFDPASAAFTSTGNMMVVRSGHTATLLTNGKVLVAGGNSAGGGTSTAELFDPATGKFTPTGNMNAARFFHTATLLSDGRVLMAGGNGGGGSTAEVYDPAAGIFTPTVSMSVERSSHTATLLTSGEVLVTGGATSGGVTTTAELFDPVESTFTSTGSMLSPREAHTATRLAEGKVFVTGGTDGNSVLSSTEVFDSVNGVFTPSENMEDRRSEHSATLLANAGVLVIGGVNYDFGVPANSLATAELTDIGAVPGTVTLSPQGMGFACHVGVGPPPGCSPDELATLTNTGGTPVYVLGVAISPAKAFYQTSHCPEVLSPGQSCTIAVGFDGSAPRNYGTTRYTATLYVSDTALGSPQKVILTGTATNN